MRLFAWVVIAALASACFLSTEPVERLALSLTLGGTVMHGDSGIAVRLEARNLRPVPLRLETVGGCLMNYRLEAPGDVDLSPRVGCALVTRELVIPAGEAVVHEFTLRPLPRYENYGTQLVRWPAGRYRIVGFLMDADARPVKETEPQTFELVCNEPGATEC